MDLTSEMRAALKRRTLISITDPAAVIGRYCCDERAERLRESVFRAFSSYSNVIARVRQRLALADELFEESIRELGYERTRRGYALRSERSRQLYIGSHLSSDGKSPTDEDAYRLAILLYRLQREEHNDLLRISRQERRTACTFKSVEGRQKFEQTLQDAGFAYSVGR